MPTDDDRSAAAESAGSSISADQPKTSLSEDRLGYADFAKAVAKTVQKMHAPDGVVMAVHGPWGSGKTSAINMVEDAIQKSQSERPESERPESEHIIIVRFNPWWISEQQDLTLAFFEELSGTIETKLSDNVKEKLRSLALRVSGSKEFIMAALSFVPGGPLAGQFGSELAGLVKDRFSDTNTLYQARTDLSDALRNQGRRILVIIDDVDRLPADEMRQIFRLVKSVADLPGVIHLLVFDRSIAEKALADLAADGGPAWLEKIVQASFDLPPIHAFDLQNLMLQGLEDVFGDVEVGDEIHLRNVFHDAIVPYVHTPRDVTRLLNAIRVTWPVVAGEVNIPDFLAIETLRVFEPSVYSAIRSNADQLTGDNFASSLIEEDGEIGNCLRTSVKLKDQHRVKNALQRLFPTLANVTGNHEYGENRMERWNVARRICTPRHFHSYFSFGVSEDVLRREEIDDFVAILDDKDAVKARVEELASQYRRSGGTRADVLLEDIRTALENEDQAVRANAASGLLFAGDAFLSNGHKDTGPFEIPATYRLYLTIQPLFRPHEQERYESILCESVDHSPSLATVSFIVDVMSGEHGRRHYSDFIPDEDRFLDEDAVIRLERALAKRLSDAAADDSILDCIKPAMCLDHWRHVGNPDDVQSWIKNKLSDDKNIIKFAKIFTGEGRAHDPDFKFVRKTFYVQRESMSELMDAEAFIERVRALSRRDGLQKGDREIIDNFLQGVDRPR